MLQRLTCYQPNAMGESFWPFCKSAPAVSHAFWAICHRGCAQSQRLVCRLTNSCQPIRWKTRRKRASSILRDDSRRPYFAVTSVVVPFPARKIIPACTGHGVSGRDRGASSNRHQAGLHVRRPANAEFLMPVAGDTQNTGCNSRLPSPEYQ